jgi:glycosyltransferase 2 family protein
VSGAPAGGKGRSSLGWKGLAGLVFSIVLLWYAFRDVDATGVLAELAAADPVLLGLAAFLVTVPFALRAVRWGILLRPIHPETRFRPRFACTCIGFMANNLLPARIGEFARAYSITRLEPIPLSGSFGSLVLERMFDAVLVIGLLALALGWPGFPDVTSRAFGQAAVGLGGLVVVGFALLFFLVSRPERTSGILEAIASRLLPSRLRRRVVDTLHAFLTGAAALRDGRLVLRSLIWSAAVWLTNGVAMWVGFRAFGIDAPLIAAIFLQSVIALAVSLPSAPGFFGVYQAAARIGLVDVWGVAAAPAMAFAVGFHLAGYFPVTFMGLYYVWRLDFSWKDVEASEEIVETAVEAEDPPDAGPDGLPDRSADRP